MTALLHLRLLGGLQVDLDDKLFSGFTTTKAAALLCYLAVTGRPHQRAALASLLWGELNEGDARNNLRVTLSYLRRDFADYLIVTRDTVAFNLDAPHVLDVRSLAALRSDTVDEAALRPAVELYQGDFLAGFYVHDAPEFEEWVAGQRERLRHLALQALHDLAVQATEQHAYATGIDYLTRLLVLDPWREETHRQLMLLLAQSGQRDAALAQYERCRRILEEALDVEPDDETAALRDQIRAGKVALAEPVLRHHLPLYPTALLGRDADLAQVAAMLGQPACRLVTLYGVGGIGKTRLALGVASALAPHYLHGAVFVSLAPISDPNLVTAAIARALDLREAAGQSLRTQLAEYLQPKQLLLVLDNFEQVTAAAPLVAELLAACPRLKVIVTSREVLRLRGEHEYVVSPLPLPADTQWALEAARAAAYASVALFVERARLVQPQFQLTSGNVAAVVDICTRLDGLPLAIELAAARIRLMSPQALVSRLSSRLTVLAGGSRDMPERQRTLRNTLQWSHELLDPDEQVLFARLGVFVSGFTLEAAEAVGAGPTPVFDLLESLVGKSLIGQRSGQDGEPRFGMLETVREYAQERLAAGGEVTVIHQRHAHYFLDLAETADPELFRDNQEQWVERLEADHDNLRAALRWALEQDDASPALRLASTLTRFWFTYGYLSEGRDWLHAALERADPSVSARLRSKALRCEGFLAHYQYDFDDALALQEEALVQGRESGDVESIAGALREIAGIAHVRDEYATAKPLYEESYHLCRTLGDTFGMGIIMVRLGNILEREDMAQAITHYQEGLALSRQAGDRINTASALTNLGEVAQAQGDYKRAAPLFAEALDLFRSVGHKHGIAWAVSKMGHMALHQGEYEGATAMYEEGLALALALGSKLAIGYSYRDLANAARMHGDHDAAEQLYGSALTVFLDLKPEGVAESLEGLARVAAERVAAEHVGARLDHAKQAAELWGAAEVIREAINAPMTLDQRTGLESLLATVRDKLGAEPFDAARAYGRTLRPHEIAGRIGDMPAGTDARIMA